MLGNRLTIALSSSAAAAFCLSAFLHAAASAPVAEAAMQNDKDAVRSLLKQAADVNAAQGDGMTALHWAAMHGDADLVQMLVYAGANVRATTRIGSYTPLYLASQQGQAKAIDVLLKAGADPKSTTPSGTTPLMVAAASGNAEAVSVLLDNGADIAVKESLHGETALMFAAANNRPAVIELLAKRGADVKATTKVLDLASLSREDGSVAGVVRGNPAPVPGEEPTAAAGAAGATGRAGRAAGPGGSGAAGQAGQGGQGGGGRFGGRGKAGIDRQFQLNELVAAQGGLTPLLFAVRQGYTDSVHALIAAGADVNQVSGGDKTSPLLMAIINGHFDLAKELLDKGANPRLAAENGATPVYAVLNCQWAPKALYPQPRAYQQQQTSYLDLMKALLDKGVDVNARLKKKVWYQGYSFDLSGVDEIGATPFWRAAYASDVDAMKLLIAHGADPNIRSMKGAGRAFVADADRQVKDVSGLPPVPLGGPAITPLQAAAGAGYGEGFAANSHRFAPGGMLAAVKYLVEELHVDVNAQDHEGNTALHHAAARGDNEMILYLVKHGADVKLVDREGKTTVDMANGPVQRIQPFPETIKLLEGLGAKNNHKCVSC
ncbi:MAG TPA: ankyrin repeat domain-containing protein [Vicinamibacterales bacterium]|jgi:ankyrin repeat protein